MFNKIFELINTFYVYEFSTEIHLDVFSLAYSSKPLYLVCYYFATNRMRQLEL